MGDRERDEWRRRTWERRREIRCGDIAMESAGSLELLFCGVIS